jgi:hypothetical protein
MVRASYIRRHSAVARPRDRILIHPITLHFVWAQVMAPRWLQFVFFALYTFYAWVHCFNTISAQDKLQRENDAEAGPPLPIILRRLSQSRCHRGTRPLYLRAMLLVFPGTVRLSPTLGLCDPRLIVCRRPIPGVVFRLCESAICIQPLSPCGICGCLGGISASLCLGPGS